MENQTFYLLCSLVEMEESVSTQHFLYTDRDKAINALEHEIYSCAENFNFDEGKFVVDNPTYYEFRDEDGYGFEVWIEEIKPIN